MQNNNNEHTFFTNSNTHQTPQNPSTQPKTGTINNDSQHSNNHQKSTLQQHFRGDATKATSQNASFTNIIRNKNNALPFNPAFSSSSSFPVNNNSQDSYPTARANQNTNNLLPVTANRTRAGTEFSSSLFPSSSNPQSPVLPLFSSSFNTNRLQTDRAPFSGGDPSFSVSSRPARSTSAPSLLLPQRLRPTTFLKATKVPSVLSSTGPFSPTPGRVEAKRLLSNPRNVPKTITQIENPKFLQQNLEVVKNRLSPFRQGVRSNSTNMQALEASQMLGPAWLTHPKYSDHQRLFNQWEDYRINYFQKHQKQPHPAQFQLYLAALYGATTAKQYSIQFQTHVMPELKLVPEWREGMRKLGVNVGENQQRPQRVSMQSIRLVIGNLSTLEQIACFQVFVTGSRVGETITSNNALRSWETIYHHKQNLVECFLKTHKTSIDGKRPYSKWVEVHPNHADYFLDHSRSYQEVYRHVTSVSSLTPHKLRSAALQYLQSLGFATSQTRILTGWTDETQVSTSTRYSLPEAASLTAKKSKILTKYLMNVIFPWDPFYHVQIPPSLETLQSVNH